jgi:hypothetical protein
MKTRVGVATRRALLLLPLIGGVASAQATLGGLTLQGTGAGLTLPLLPTGSYTSSITISGFTDYIAATATNQTVAVRLNSLVHTWAGDLSARVFFQSEALGTTFRWDLFSRPGRGVAGSAFGTNRDYNGDYAFGEFNEDEGLYTGDLIDEFLFGPNTALASGNYFAFDAFSGQDYGSPGDIFGGLLPNGIWTLQLIDWEAGDGGSLGSWDLAFNAPSTAVPEPSSFALLAFGVASLAAVARRRRLS